jgi:hypothetical protein
MGNAPSLGGGVWEPGRVNPFFIEEKQMKKLLAVALGVLLVAMAVPVFAATDLSFSGGYVLMHNIHDNYQRSANRDGNAGFNDSFFRHRFNLKLTFQATEDIKVVWQIRAPHWGNWGSVGSGAVGSRYNAQSRYFYAEISQPWGTIQIGRVADGSPGVVGGLATLGHGPSWGSGGYLYAGGSVFNAWNDVSDGINYNVQLDNGFGFAAYYYKMSDSETPNRTVDDDVERFGIEPRYLWDGGGLTFGLLWVRNMAPLNETMANIFDLSGLDNYLYFDSFAPKDDYTFVINPAIAHSWGQFSIGFEGAFAWGKTTYVLAYRDNTDRYSVEMELDKKGYGLYFDATYNYGAGDINFLAWWTDGTDWQADDPDFSDAIGLGDFAPFLVAFGYNSIAAGIDGNSLNQWAYGNQAGFANFGDLVGGGSNQWGIGLLGNHSVTDDIAFNWGVGYFALVEPYAWNNERGSNTSKSLGWEIDLGATFNLLDNLTYETQFGYFFNGDAFDRWNGQTWVQAKDTFAWLNVLAVSF